MIITMKKNAPDSEMHAIIENLEGIGPNKSP